jgi:rare lipoprotein A
LSRSPALTLLVLAALAAPASASAQAPADISAPALTATPGALLGRTLRIDGRIGGDAGRTVEIQRLQDPGRWVPVARAATDAGGAFAARWRTDALGRHTLRAVAGGVQAAATPVTAQVTVFRPARATWYGPGLFGRRTACGQRLTRTLLGVAHKRLRCGTPVEVLFRGRSITVPVVDRGPFAHGASYDLTAAAARQLGFEQTSTIGVSPRRRGSAEPAPAPAAPPAPPSGGVAPQLP